MWSRARQVTGGSASRRAEANSPLASQIGGSMEDPVSPGAESLWDADSDATSELSDIYGDLDDLAAGNAEAENTEDYARKEVKSKTLVNNSVSVCESEENEVQDGSSVNTQKKAKKKQARDCTRKSVESHSKKKSKSHHIKHEAIQIKKEKETDSLNDNPTALQLSASLNKDLQFVLSRVIKNSKHPLESRENDLSAKNNDVSKDQHSLTKDGKNESDQSLSSSREKTPSSQGDYKSAASEDKVEGKGKVLEVQEGNPSDGKNVRKVATVAEESHTPPRSVPVSVASSDVVQNIMMMAQVSKRSTAADYMNVGHASTTSKTKSYRIPKKTKKETENNQLDLFEDFLVGQDRDEVSFCLICLDVLIHLVFSVCRVTFCKSLT
ncbi:hypothetical protein E2C01_016972 [Portunus trituberculatus]|uniref:Uncharacterized protein n=1 Tax=Portunus trituberculatus TaxID=210409 RepID=A0A5B7DRN4_PORTR|nr:hypothetical protein [Portunus trituberculatus]